MRGSKRRPVDLDLAFGALDADGRPGRVVGVDVGTDAQVGEGDAVRGGGGGRGGEGQDHGGHFVGAGAGVFVDGADDGGRLAGGGGLRVVEGLEDPG